MIIRELGTKYRNKHYQYDRPKHQPYDYQLNGLLNKILPERITSTKNTTTAAVLKSVEYILVWLMKYVDILKNFKNPHFIKY